MTDTGYEHIIKLIKERHVEVPSMTAEQSIMWWHGWSACQEEILDLLEKLIRDNERR